MVHWITPCSTGLIFELKETSNSSRFHGRLSPLRLAYRWKPSWTIHKDWFYTPSIRRFGFCALHGPVVTPGATHKAQPKKSALFALSSRALLNFCSIIYFVDANNPWTNPSIIILFLPRPELNFDLALRSPRYWEDISYEVDLVWDKLH
jgi:hypothetical protein